MYSKKANTIVGFHGCSREIRDRIVNHEVRMNKSEKSYDWLGNGMYFWENDLNRAWEWADAYKQAGKIEEPAVLGAIIDLGFCLDFINFEYLSLLKPAYNRLKEHCRNIGAKQIPQNVKPQYSSDLLLRHLDCAVIEMIHQEMRQSGKGHFDSVRGVFWEGKEPYSGAGFKEKNHIQICIRNPNCIKGYFIPRTKDVDWPMP